MQSNKKGQVTIFIILGIVIVIIIALALYLINTSNKNEFVQPNIKVDAQFAPVQDYVQQCMNTLLTESVVKIGQHGGYIDPTDPLMTGFDIVANTAQQYNSDLAFLSPTDKNTGVAYWFHAKSMGGCDNCFVNTLAPSLGDMEQQITHYITRNMQSCLDSFSVFDGKGYDIVDAHDYSVRTSISETGVAVIMNAGIVLKIGDQNGELTQFYTETDIPLKKYYDMATIITIKEVENNFLENIGLYLINAHSGLSTSRLPPMHDLTEGYSVLMWSKTNAKQQFKSLLTSYIPVLRVPRTRNFFDVDYTRLTPSEKYFYNATKLDFFDNVTLSNTEVSFAYLGQDIYFDITPPDGSHSELLKPTTDEPTKFSYFFEDRIMNKYDFYYQTSYPVVVVITEEYKPKSTFTFMFALEGNIKDNLKVSDYLNDSNARVFWDKSFITVKYNAPESGTTDLSGYDIDPQLVQEYAQNMQNSQNNGFTAPPTTRFCNPAQRISKSVKLQTYDSVTGQSLSDVSVKFGCGHFVECDMGRAVYNYTLQESVWQGSLPTCKNGYVTLTKENHLPKTVLLSTDLEITQDLGSIYLDPIITKTFVLKKYGVTKNTTLDSEGNPVYTFYNLSNNASEISDNESVIITLEKITMNNLDEQFSQSVMLSKSFDVNSTEIMLTPGKYSISVQVLDYTGIFIPKGCKTVCTKYSSNGKKCEETDTLPDDDIVINPAPLGGIEFTNQTFLYISPSDLLGDNILEINIIKMPYPKCIDDMDDLSNIGLVSEQYHQTLIPKFVSSVQTP